MIPSWQTSRVCRKNTPCCVGCRTVPRWSTQRAAIANAPCRVLMPLVKAVFFYGTDTVARLQRVTMVYDK